MLSKQDNELLHARPRQPMGELFRRFWLPVAALRGAARPGLRAGARPGPGRGPHRLPRHRRPRRPGRRLLPAPRRADVLRPQRGRRPALRLPRLEVRRRPASASTCRTRPRARPSRTRSTSSAYPCEDARRPDLGLHGPEGQAAAVPGVRVDASCPTSHRYVTKFRVRVQLPAGDGRATSTPPRPFLHSTLNPRVQPVLARHRRDERRHQRREPQHPGPPRHLRHRTTARPSAACATTTARCRSALTS